MTHRQLQLLKKKYLREGYKMALNEKRAILRDTTEIPSDINGKSIQVGDVVECELHHCLGEVEAIKVSDRFERTGNFFIIIRDMDTGKIVKTTQDDVEVLVKGYNLGNDRDRFSDSGIASTRTLGGSNY